MNKINSTKEIQINVSQGEYEVSSVENTVMSTILGSCVATCLYDPVVRIGGMNHYLLPDGEVNPNERVIHGLYAMELLINEILKRGGLKKNLVAKLFGGARIINNISDIGSKNADFGREFLKKENIPCVAESLGGRQARRVKFWPCTGKAKMLSVHDPREEKEYMKPRAAKLNEAQSASDVELF